MLLEPGKQRKTQRRQSQGLAHILQRVFLIKDPMCIVLGRSPRHSYCEKMETGEKDTMEIKIPSTHWRTLTASAVVISARVVVK